MSALDRPMSWLGVMGFEVCLGSEVEVSMVVAFSKQLSLVAACLGMICNSLILQMVLPPNQIKGLVCLQHVEFENVDQF